MAGVGKFLRKKRLPDRGTPVETNTVTPAASPTSALMELPAELRLVIWDLVLADHKVITLHIGTRNIDRNELRTSLGCGASEMRIFIPRLSLCRQAREEVQQVFYDNTTFILAVSLYQYVSTNPYDDSMKSLPSGIVPGSVLDRIKHLALVTELRRSSWTRHGFRAADLRYLQAMTDLRSIRLVFRNPFAFNSAGDELDERCAVPVRSVVESIPTGTSVLLGLPSCHDPSQGAEGHDTTGSIAAGQRSDGSTTQQDELVAQVYAKVLTYIQQMQSRRGILSGSTMSHSYCFRQCEQDRGCVNSTMGTPPPKKAYAFKMTVAKTVSKIRTAEAKQGMFYRGDGM